MRQPDSEVLLQARHQGKHAVRWRAERLSEVSRSRTRTVETSLRRINIDDPDG
jgi:hypothetical protein